MDQIRSITSPADTPRSPNYARRRLGAVVASGAAALGSVAAVNAIGNHVQGVQERNRIYSQTAIPDAMQDYKDGKIDPTKVTVVVAPRDGVASDLASELHPDGNILPLSDAIHAQSGANGIPGVQRGEEFVVDKSQVQVPDNE